MKLTVKDKQHLLDVAIRAFGMICLVIGIVALYCIGYYQGMQTVRKRTTSLLKQKDERIKHLEADSVYMRDLIFKP